MNRKQELIRELMALEKASPVAHVGHPKDLASTLIAKFGRKKKEHFLCTTLDGAHNVIKTHVVTIGILTRTVVHPREVFVEAIKDRSAAIIVSHNHPSGQLEPSSEDRKLTDRLEEAGRILGIPVLDHLVFGETGFYSMLAHGEMSGK